MATVDRIKAILEAEDRSSNTFNVNTAAIAALGAAAVAAAVKIGQTLTAAMFDAAEAAGKQEEAEVLLASSLRTLGSEAQSTVADLKEYAGQLQDITGVGDEVILANQRLLVSIGRLSGKGLKEATEAALDLAAATGVNQRTAFDLVAKAATGYTGTLSRYGILIDQSLPDNEKYAAALKLINEQFGGAAKDRLDTYIGSMEELRGRVGDLQEAFGGPFKDVITALNREAISPLIKSFTEAVKTSDVFRNTVLRTALAMVELFDIAERVTRTLRNLGTELVRLKLEEFDTVVGFLTKRIKLLEAALTAMGISVRQDSLPAVEELRARLEKLLEGFKDTDDETKGFDKTVTVTAGSIKTFAQAVDDLILGLTVTRDDIGSIGGELRNSLGPVALRTVSTLGNALADMAFTGEFAFKKFVESALKGVAAIIAQVLILRGLIALFPNFLGGGGGGSDGLLGFIPGIGGFLGSSVAPGIGGGISSAALPVPTSGAISLRLSLDPGVVVNEVNDAVERGSVTLTATRLKQVRNVR